MRPDELEPMSDAMRALLDVERPLDAVPEAVRARLFTNISATMAGAGAAGAAAAGTAKASAAVGAKVAGGTALATKVLIATVAFSVGGGVGAGVHAVVTRQANAPQPAPIVINLPPTVQPERSPEGAESKAAEEPPPPPAKPAPAPAAPKPNDNLGAERSLVEQARAALSRHDPAAALIALQQHEREHPRGQLAEERTALEVLALSESGNAAKAHELAAKFRAKYPGSLLLPAVDAASPP